jgi:hypothetical protein
MSPRGKTSAGLLTVIALVFSAILAGPASAGLLDRGAEPTADRSCGSVVVQRSLTYQLSVEKGSPSCGTVRRIAKKYGHPTSKKPKFFCGHKIYECEYSTYPEGWRCGGLFQGTFQCWHGANSPARADEGFNGRQDLSARPLMRKSRDAFEFYAEQAHARDKTQCAIYDGYAGLSEAFCTSYPPREGKAAVDADGSVMLCRAPKGAANACLVGNVGEGAPTLRYGRHVSVGRFRCTVLRSGVKCVVRATGKGFVFSSRRERAVGGASAERTGRRARALISDRRLLGSSGDSSGPLYEDRLKARAPCTEKAIEAGLGRGDGRLLTKTSFRCAGRFAYADVKIADYEAVQLLRSYGRHWKVVDRGKYCEAGVVPAKIRYFACEVS